MVYLVGGQLNLHKSMLCSEDFLRYLHVLGNQYRLTEYGSVLGMDHYGVISKTERELKLQKIKQHVVLNTRKGKNKPVNAHSSEFTGNKLVELAREHVPNTLDIPISGLWNMDLMECLEPFQVSKIPPELEPTSDEVITLNDEQIDLGTLDDKAREEVLNRWREANPSEIKDNKGPAGFIFGLQEPYINPKNNKLGPLEKAGHALLYDRTSLKPRAAILASKNLNVWLETDLTDSDMVTCKYDTGNPDIPTIYIVSLYCDITITSDIVPRKLRSLLRRCQRTNEGCLIYADLNGHSHLWGSPTDNARGEVFEDELIRHFTLDVLNQGDIPTYYGGNTLTGTHVDAGLCTNNITHLIKNWVNRDSVPSSDHALLEHTLFLGKPQAETYKYNYKKAKREDWYSFMHTLDNSLKFKLPDTGDYETFDKGVEEFYSKIYEAREKAIPRTKIDPMSINKNARGDTWYTKKCKSLFNRIRAIRSYLRKLKNNPLPEGVEARASHHDLTVARKEYWKEVRKCKRRSYQEHLETREGAADMGSFNRNFLKQSSGNRVLELFKKADGTTMTPEETLNCLAEEKFPGCRDELQQAPFTSQRQAKESKATYDLVNDPRADWITIEKVKASINSFGSHKGVGSDDIPPIIYKHFGPKAWDMLVKIYKVTFLLGLLPKKWLDVKVIFLAKNGKKKYDEPGSWRPIGLMQHQMKGLEKLTMWDNEVKVDKPLHLNQHGFRKCRSTISSLSCLVGEIEYAIKDDGFGLAAFVDVSGAFDKVKNASIQEGLSQRPGTRESTITWLTDFLENRNIQINMMGIETKKYCTQGTPQGSTASPYLWNIIADELHEEIEKLSDVTSQGFADDTVLLATGKDVHYVQHAMQKALLVAEKWQNKHGLHFAPGKTVVILFTRKTKYEQPMKLKLNGLDLEYKTHHKHLGVYLNSKLDPGYHLNMKVKEGKAVAVRLASSMGKIWGLTPEMARWIYRMVIRPIIVYGALIWFKAVFTNKHRKTLERTQRFCLMQLGYCRAKTPVAALEVISNTIPLDLFILYDATCSFIRTRGHEKFTRDEMHTLNQARKGHRQLLVEYAESKGFSHLLEVETDNMSALFNWDRKYKIETSSFDQENPKKGVPTLHTDCNIYTDGSRLGQYRAGAAISVWKKHEAYTRFIERPIPNHDKEAFYLEDSSIFQCEVFAAGRAASWLTEHASSFGIKTACINIDSQAAIKTLMAPRINQKLVYHVTQLLNEAADNLESLSIRWVKAHVDGSEQHRGNAFADSAAKLGAIAADSESLVHPSDLPLRSMGTLKTELFSYYRGIWKHKWRNNLQGQPKCRETKLFFPEPNPKLSYDLITKRSRYEYSVLIHAITGHNHLAYHEHVQSKRTSDPTCTICKIPDTIMCTEHIFRECEAFGALRLQIFGTHNPDTLDKLPTSQIIEFLRETNVGWLPSNEG